MVGRSAAASPQRLTNIGNTIDQMHLLRERKRKLELEVTDIESEYKVLEEALIDRLDQEGTTKGNGKFASASISSSVVGNVTDWARLNAYIKKTGYFHLYQQRLSAPAVRELFDQGKKVPGVEPFTQRRLNLRVSNT